MANNSCDNCGKKAHENLKVESKSIPGGHIYKLCLFCAYTLKSTRTPTIGDICISKNTKESFRKQVKDIINEAYDAATLYKHQVTVCNMCKTPQKSTILDFDDTIQEALGINKSDKFCCKNCIQNLL